MSNGWAIAIAAILAFDVAVGIGTLAVSLSERRRCISKHARTAHDVAEHHNIETYGQAIQQLGHETAAVRMGGLYTLERVANADQGYRQTVMDIICAYLRIPFAPPAVPSDSPDDDVSTNAHAELQVRLTAQGLLRRHLEIPGPDGDAAAGEGAARFWPGMRIDLSGAHLVDLNLSQCHLGQGDFDRAVFHGSTFFAGARFDGDALFGHAHFRGDVNFHDAEFRAGTTWFGESRFDGEADFGDGVFCCDVDFEEASFHGAARFHSARFEADAGFVGVHFRHSARFDSAEFTGPYAVSFEKARFHGDAWFYRAKFRSFPEFMNASADRRDDHHSWPDRWRLDPNSSDQRPFPLVHERK